MDFTLLPPDAQRDELTCDMEGVPTDESNLVIKASWLLAWLNKSCTLYCQEFQVCSNTAQQH